MRARRRIDCLLQPSCHSFSLRKGLTESVRGRGAAVLGARKLSSAMSAANAIASHLADWLVAPAPVKVGSRSGEGDHVFCRRRRP